MIIEAPIPVKVHVQSADPEVVTLYCFVFSSLIFTDPLHR